jgi:subtilase family serine protease
MSAAGKTMHSGYNANGRGYPDVSVAGALYEVVIGGSWYLVSGTSASAPVVAGMISLVNAARMKKGLSAVGWINPALYALYQNFTMDITSGDNKCSAYGELCCDEGFETADGWDPVTGLGSLNFTLFKETFLSLGKKSSLYRPTYAPTPGARKPTSKPTSPSPTTAPTAAPTQAAGWIYAASYDRGDCEGPPEYAYGYPTNNCIQEYSTDGSASVLYSFRYTCTQGLYSFFNTFFSCCYCLLLLLLFFPRDRLLLCLPPFHSHSPTCYYRSVPSHILPRQ